MLAFHGYYDGVSIKPLEKIIAQPNQRVIITITDDFIEPMVTSNKKNLRGILASYANSSLSKQEKEAWEHAAIQKYGNL